MISDIDREMESRKLKSIIVTGSSTLGNPELHYVVGTQIPRGGIYVKPLGKDPTIITSGLDLGSARKGRVRQVRTYPEYGYERLLQKYNRNEARVRLYRNIIREEGLQGPLSIMGTNEISSHYQLVEDIHRSKIKVVGQNPPTVLDSARETKDRREIEMLDDTSKKTCNVIDQTVRFLRSCRPKGDKVYYKSKPLTVATVKKVIGRLLGENGLTTPEGTIFAAGRKSSDPHYSGEAQDIVRTREPIVFDIFPQAENGYWSDITRTFCIGQPSRKLQEMYDAVLETQLDALDTIKEGGSGKDVMNHACDMFQAHGYLTYRDFTKGDKRADKEGFMHSLGHGMGLTIGERPLLSLVAEDKLKRGAVVTVEPGLYYPKHGGVRIEDDLVIGSPPKNLTYVEKELII